MITSTNTSKLLISQSKDNNNVKLKSKSSLGKSDSEFMSVFSKTLDNTAKSTKTSTASKNNNDISKDSDSNLKYKSFRDVQLEKNSGTKQRSVEKPASDINSKKVDLETEKSVNGSDEYDESINVLAQMLGMQPSELVKLANELGFSGEDLKDTKTLSLFVDKLANALQLSDSQKTMMNTLVKEVSKLVKPEDGLEVVSTDQSSKVAPKEVNSSNNTKTDELSKIAEDVKLKLDQLIQNATVNSESISSEISKVIAAMKAQAQTKVTVNTQQVELTSDTAAEGIPNAEQLSVNANITDGKESAKASNHEKEDNSKSDNSSDTKTQVDTNGVNTQVRTGSDQNQQLNEQNVQTIADVKIGMSNSQIDVSKPVFSTPQPIKSSEVLNQVVEQAKVIIGQDKSEMIINLKPDHLGKLELKVVTEQGIVAAKFIAESQQVKEIIETNMQLLKDSLQKQGILIEAISVQVGNDRQSEYQQQNSFQSKNSSSRSGQKYGSSESGISNVGFNAFDALPERLAQYANETNTINLTA